MGEVWSGPSVSTGPGEPEEEGGWALPQLSPIPTHPLAAQGITHISVNSRSTL